MRNIKHTIYFDIFSYLEDLRSYDASNWLKLINT